MSAKYAIGIDLGTTNSVLAYAPLDVDRPAISLLAVPQNVAPGQVDSLDHLPSFVYLPTDQEQQSRSLAWHADTDGSLVVGNYARRVSAEQPERTIAAAKSWLCHAGVDRQGPILPWDAPQEVSKISPVTASMSYLRHLVSAWHLQFPEVPIEEQRIVLTVPASFDLAARELTRHAALAAGLPGDFLLLEEPQAAVYHWLSSKGDAWRHKVSKGDVILVLDVGGGTTDLTLVAVDEEQGEVALRRLAVGNHLLVGGDNMDLALAHFAAQKFAEQGTKLNPWQSISLWHSCRNAKETLLSENGMATQNISVLGRGSRLIGGTVSMTMDKADAEHVLIEGFFPKCEKDERPIRQPSSGFQELGLPFESDTAVTRHVAAFLQDQSTVEQPLKMPNKLLFNGGVFKAKSLRDRFKSVLGSWNATAEPVDVLGGPEDLDKAVACGAAFYAWSKLHGGVRIRGGTARSYYVGIETAGLSVPGLPRPLNALCVLPFGTEEGSSIDVPGKEVGLVVGQRASFRFFASSIRKQDKVGTVLKYWEDDELQETAPLELVLPASENETDRFVPVRFHSNITEMGIFELWCVSSGQDRRWKLELNVRES